MFAEMSHFFKKLYYYDHLLVLNQLRINNFVCI